jgi:hypothetical protein
VHDALVEVRRRLHACARPGLIRGRSSPRPSPGHCVASYAAGIVQGGVDGTYSVSYSVPHAGPHLLSVCLYTEGLGERHLPGSPFVVNVRAGAAAAHASELVAEEQPLHAILGQPVQIRVIARDGNGVRASGGGAAIALGAPSLPPPPLPVPRSLHRRGPFPLVLCRKCLGCGLHRGGAEGWGGVRVGQPGGRRRDGA